MEAYWGAQAQEQARGFISSDEGNHEGVVGGGVRISDLNFNHSLKLAFILFKLF